MTRQVVGGQTQVSRASPKTPMALSIAAAVDFECFNRDFGLSLPHANFQPMVDALLADLNAQGGILDRRVDVVHRLFLPVGPESAEVLCWVRGLGL